MNLHALSTVLIAFVAAVPSAAPGLEDLVTAERAFAKASEERGVREAFLSYLDDDAVLFRPGPVPGLPWMRERPAPKGTLLWLPDFADLAASRELGATSGPWEYRSPVDAGRPPEHGHFVTIWRHDRKRGWKVAVDIGVSHAEEPAAPAAVASPPSRAAARLKPRAWRDARASFLAAEAFLSTRASIGGVAEALLELAAGDVRVYREGSLPAYGLEAARAALAPDAAHRSFKVLGYGVSRSGDLGYAYGTRSSHPDQEDASFLRVWRREPGGTWRISLDVAVPIPAAPPS